jgi:hypothetical protein
MIWRSPLWMPLAWEVVTVQFGYIGLRLCERFGKVGLLMIGLLGAINIPFYEEMARRIHWWLPHDFVYAVVHHSRRVRYCARLRVACANLRRGSWRGAVLAGIGGGFSIFVCYALAFWITDRLIT